MRRPRLRALAAAAAKTNDPVRQGLVCMTGTFIDTIVLCTITGLAIVVTGAWDSRVTGGALQGFDITAYSWAEGIPFSPAVSTTVLSGVPDILRIQLCAGLELLLRKVRGVFVQGQPQGRFGVSLAVYRGGRRRSVYDGFGGLGRGRHHQRAHGRTQSYRAHGP